MPALMFRIFFIAFLGVADAGLSDKVKSRGSDGYLPADAKSSSSSPIIVRLQRVESYGIHSYVGRLRIGEPEPQELQVLFDTASGHVLLPHQACKDAACKSHRRYSPWRSSTSKDIQLDGSPVQPGHRLARGSVTRDALNVDFTQADLGDGTSQAVLVRDQVCLGDTGAFKACSEVDVLAALKMDDMPFGKMPNDGIVGLGLSGLSGETQASIFHKLLTDSNLNKADMLPQFGISFGAGSGELFLGGHDESRLAGPLQWFSVLHPEDGFWEVEIKEVRVGEHVVDSCDHGCRGIVDTGASLLGVGSTNYDSFKNTLADAVSPGIAGGCVGSDLEFDLGGMALTFRPSDYTGARCVPQLGSLNLTDMSVNVNSVYTFGETMLRRYYTAFDWKLKRIGFAPAAKRLVRLDGRGSQTQRPKPLPPPEQLINVFL
eukprot:TRINITY_DN94243_c0_g1_i1.p1 TRINITY_DN94243_c0_g1~~TRINITY_DN94243_c0_g1_i1.p1  ORF type:complete len:431 (-),score=73.14 TRINITY_DN94243_c0_g1_i1:141-1433(-)